MGNEARRANKETETTSETANEGKTLRDPIESQDPKKITADESDKTAGRNK